MMLYKYPRVINTHSQIDLNMTTMDDQEISNASSQQLIKPFAIKKGEDGNTTYVQWSDLMLRKQIDAGLQNAGYQFPSQVQYRIISKIMKEPNRDLICQAKSGMGKTATYILAILQDLTPQQDGRYLKNQYFVIVNTRQLAHQVYKEFRKLSVGFKLPQLRIAAYFGGLPLWDMRHELANQKQAPHIIIGTMGRLIHLIKEEYLDMDYLKWMVLDECDRLAGEPDLLADLKFLLENTPKNKQILMFSATIPQKTLKLCLSFLRADPIVECLQKKKVNLKTLKHFYLKCDNDEKWKILYNILDTIPFTQAIIFANGIDRAMHLADLLRSQLFNPICIHSRLPQTQRLRCYDIFRMNNCRLIVATDIIGRGIDFKNVNLIINYDFPDNCESYMHRGARASRFGNKGTVINFIRIFKNTSSLHIDDKIAKRVTQEYGVNMEILPENVDTIVNA